MWETPAFGSQGVFHAGVRLSTAFPTADEGARRGASSGQEARVDGARADDRSRARRGIAEPVGSGASFSFVPSKDEAHDVRCIVGFFAPPAQFHD